MTPQEWIDSAKQADDQLENLWFIAEGAAHLATALEEIARLRAEAGRVVVPEFDANDALHFGQSFEEAGDLGKQAEFLRGWLASEFRTHSVPSSRVLKDGEVGVRCEDWDAARMWEYGGVKIHKIEFEGGFRFCVKRGELLILGRSGAWDYNRPPSSRDEEFFREFRFDSFRAALDALRTQATATESGKAREVEAP